jgi:hypothetical protein
VQMESALWALYDEIRRRSVCNGVDSLLALFPRELFAQARSRAPLRSIALAFVALALAHRGGGGCAGEQLVEYVVTERWNARLNLVETTVLQFPLVDYDKPQFLQPPLLWTYCLSRRSAEVWDWYRNERVRTLAPLDVRPTLLSVCADLIAAATANRIDVRHFSCPQ